VQKAIDALPDSHDHTDEVQADEKRSRTDTDNLSQEDEEKKDEKNPWGDQEPMIKKEMGQKNDDRLQTTPSLGYEKGSGN